MKVVCSRAGEHSECQGCHHGEPHIKLDSCRKETCGSTEWVVGCVPVVNKDLVAKLKTQIERTEETSYFHTSEAVQAALRTKENQILIMEALAELLEAR